NGADEQSKAGSPDSGSKNHAGSYYAIPVQNAAHSSTEEYHRQINKIRGIVYAEAGTALPGVSVSLKGTSTAVMTNAGGEFEITLPDNMQNGVLVFSS